MKIINNRTKMLFIKHRKDSSNVNKGIARYVRINFSKFTKNNSLNIANKSLSNCLCWGCIISPTSD